MLCSVADAFSASAARAAPIVAPRAAVTPTMMLSPAEVPFAAARAATLLAELIDEDGERIYGAVDAPAWVLPVGGILLIGTALVPLLLAPGDEAFRRQQEDEAKLTGQNRGDKFGRGRRD